MKYILLLATVFTLCTSTSVAEKSEFNIWDGTAEVILFVELTDAFTHKPISGAIVAAIREGRVARGPDGRLYETSAARKTDHRGRATLKVSFPAAGDPTGCSVFVGKSYVAVDVPGYVPRRTRISAINRLDFPAKTKNCKVSIHLVLKSK